MWIEPGFAVATPLAVLAVIGSVHNNTTVRKLTVASAITAAIAWALWKRSTLYDTAAHHAVTSPANDRAQNGQTVDRMYNLRKTTLDGFGPHTLVRAKLCSKLTVLIDAIRHDGYAGMCTQLYALLEDFLQNTIIRFYPMTRHWSPEPFPSSSTSAQKCRKS